MNTSNQTETSVIKDVKHGAVTIDKLYKSDYQKKGTQSVQLRQEVVTKSSYPSVQPKTGGLFSTAEFGLETQDFESKETRIAWIDVPETATVDVVATRLAALASKGIMKVLANKPILNANQKNAIERGIAEMDTFANSQIVRYPDEHEKSGEIILDKNGKIQYRVNNFEPEMTNDVLDKRTADPADYYASEELEQELAELATSSTGMFNNQTL